MQSRAKQRANKVGAYPGDRIAAWKAGNARETTLERAVYFGPDPR